MMNNEWETVIGLEIHAQLATLSKIFSSSPTKFGAEPNTQASAIDLGLPGVLPVLNKEAVTMAIKFGLSIDAKIAERSVFDRKNYFYPDLPKGYQISQFQFPIVEYGHIDLSLEQGIRKKINIRRAHLEEDAGKSLHEDFHGSTGIDLNRAGTPLLEIVSEPEMRSAKEAVEYLKSIHTLVRYLEICDGNMQEGSFRCDVNVSVRRYGDTKLGTRTELKNINSFRFVEKAIAYEVERQINLLENGQSILQETRLFDPVKNETRSMRSKEEANDYRYFPDPDLLPVIVDQAWIDAVRAALPELPRQKQERFVADYGLNTYDATLLTSSREMADYYEEVVKYSQGQTKLAANWITSELLGALNKASLEIEETPVSAKELGHLILRIADNTISGKMAKSIFESVWNQEGSVNDLIQKGGLQQISDSKEIEKIIDAIMADHPQHVADYRAGKEKLFGFFVGLAMKASGGKINPQQLNELLKEKLK